MSRAEIVPAAALYSRVVDIVKQWGKKSCGLVRSCHEGRELPFIYVENKGGGLYKDGVNSADCNIESTFEYAPGRSQAATYNQFILDYSVNKSATTSGAAFL